MKKTCFGCRALYIMDLVGRFVCRLKYNINSIPKKIKKLGTHYIPVPGEPCSKPTTWKKYFNEDLKEGKCQKNP